MTRKRAFELAALALSVSVFGAIQFSLGMRYADPIAPAVFEVSICGPEEDGASANQLHAL